MGCKYSWLQGIFCNEQTKLARLQQEVWLCLVMGYLWLLCLCEDNKMEGRVAFVGSAWRSLDPASTTSTSRVVVLGGRLSSEVLANQNDEFFC